MAKEVNCPQHGRQGIGLVCSHIAQAIDSGERVGFFWGDDTDTARPDAWCRACQQALLAVPAGESTEAWFRACSNKVLCAACWDLARQRLYEEPRRNGGAETTSSPTTPLPSPTWCRDRSLVYEQHPVPGEYIYEPTIDAWKQGRATADKHVFLLRGRGRRPTDEQEKLWSQIEARLPELTRTAIAAVPAPPVASRARFSPTDLVLGEVRIEPDLTIHLFFDSPLTGEIELSPQVVFSNWAVTAAEWVC